MQDANNIALQCAENNFNREFQKRMHSLLNNMILIDIISRERNVDSRNITIADTLSNERDYVIGRKRHLRKMFYGGSIAQQVAANIRITVSLGYGEFPFEVY